jgi:2-methylcitrate dehydratase PrpD
MPGSGPRRATIKKWTSGSPIQAALDALEALIREHGIGAKDVASLTVRLPDDRAHLVDDRDMPDICVQHLLAVMLIDGHAGLPCGARPGADA